MIRLDNPQGTVWLRAGVFKAYEGLLWAASLFMGVDFKTGDVRTTIIIVCVGLAFGASAMAICEFVSASSQFDINETRLKREGESMDKAKIRFPAMAAMASAVGFAFGAMWPLAAAFIGEYKVRLAAAVGVASVASLAFGMLIAVLGETPVVKSSLRFLIGGWLLMIITFGLITFLDEFGSEKEPVCGCKCN